MRKENIVVMFMIVLLLSVCAVQVLGQTGGASNTDDISKQAALTMSLVNQDPDPAIAGDTLDVRIGIANIGGVATENTVVELVPSYPFEAVPGESLVREIGSLDAYQGAYTAGENSQIVKFSIRVNRDATAGSYQLKVLDYEAGSNVKTQSTFTVDVKSQENAEIIHIDKTVIVPGKETPLKFTINNVGNAPLRDLTFFWENGENIILPVGSDNTKYIKYIDVGESAEVDYNVIADTNANPGLYKLDLYLKYNDPLTNSEKTISTIAGVYVGGGTDFEVSFSESSASDTTFSVANVGSNEAYSVSVMIPDQSGWKVAGSNSVIIGSLDKGDYTVATFTLQSSSSLSQRNTTGTGGFPQRSASGSSSLLVRISYTDTMGTRETVDKTVSMSSSSLSAGNGTSTNYANGQYAGFGARNRTQTPVLTYVLAIAGTLVVIGGVLGYIKYKREKLVNPKYKVADLFKRKSKK